MKRIFALCAAGNGPSRIATILTKEKVLCPSYYTYQKYGLTHSALDITKPYHWSDSAVANLLENEIYIGNTLNYRFSTRSYKDKRKIEHPREECLVFENTHPAIISKEVWDIVQRVRTVSYTHLDVYKRQAEPCCQHLGSDHHSGLS